MIIEDLNTTTSGDRKRVSAKVKWEDCDRPQSEVYFETDAEFGDGLSPNPHSFLIGCSMAAMNRGEKRIIIDAAICPELLDGLHVVIKRFAYWYDRYRFKGDTPVRIEVKKRFSKSLPPTEGRRAMFFSGGIDSLASLRNNRNNFPIGHPSSIDDAFLVYGLEVEDPKIFEYVMKTIPKIAKEASLTLIPIYTNLRYLEDSWGFWEKQFMGALFSAIGHSFSRRINSLLIASHYDIPYLNKPYGSHPLIDSNYSSSDLRIKHDRPLSRYEKTQMISDWECAIQNVRVCNKTKLYEAEQLNCSECEKCLRTMMGLLACGVLDKASAFKYDDVSQEMVRRTVKLNKTVYSFYTELIRPLKKAGRNDLADVISDKLNAYLNPAFPKQKQYERRVVAVLSAIDKELLNGRLRKIKRSLQ